MNDWKAIVLANWEQINSLAVKRFGDTSLAEEAALYVMDMLVEGNYRRLRNYSGSAPVATFVASVSWRLLEDFARKRYGRKRPPLWISNLGGMWLKLYRLLCLERMSVTEAAAAVSQDRQGNSEQLAEETAMRIKQQITDCGSHQAVEVDFDESQIDHSGSVQERGQVGMLEEREKEKVFRMLFLLLTRAESQLIEKEVRLLKKFRLQLSTEEKLLLKLCYQDNISVVRAGAMLGLNRHQANGRLRRLLARIHQEFVVAGIGKDIQDMMR